MPRSVNSCTTIQGWWSFGLPLSPIMQNAENHVWISFSDQVGLLSVGHARLSHTFSRELAFEPSLIRKIYPRLVFCTVGLKESLEDHVPRILEHDFRWTHQFEVKKILRPINICGPLCTCYSVTLIIFLCFNCCAREQLSRHPLQMSLVAFKISGAWLTWKWVFDRNLPSWANKNGVECGQNFVRSM